MPCKKVAPSLNRGLCTALKCRQAQRGCASSVQQSIQVFAALQQATLAVKREIYGDEVECYAVVVQS